MSKKIVNRLNKKTGEWTIEVVYERSEPLYRRNPRSKAQTESRDLMAALGREWGKLSLDQRNQWRLWACLTSTTTRLSGCNAFIKANRLARSVGQTAIIKAPQPHTPAPNPINNFDGDYTGKALIIIWPKITNTSENQFVRVWIDSPQGIFHRQMITFAPAKGNTATITQIRGANGDSLELYFIAHSYVTIQLDVVDRETGLVSELSKKREFNIEGTETDGC